MKLVNSELQNLLLFLTNFSTGYSLDPYIGVIQLSASATWLTDPEIVPLSSFRFQELEVIEGGAQPSESFFLLKPILEKISRAFPTQRWKMLGNNTWLNQESPVIFLLSDGNFHESPESIHKNINSTINGKCIRIPVMISNFLAKPFREGLMADESGGGESMEFSVGTLQLDKDYNFELLDAFRADYYYYGQPIIDPVHILKLKKINDFFKIPFQRQDKRDE